MRDVMGTSSDSRGGEDGGEIIPFNCVGFRVRQKLIQKLNTELPLSGNDWRMLASLLGFNLESIQTIESFQKIHTEVLFKQYDTEKGNSFNKVFKSLQEMKRDDCVEILRDAYPEIYQEWQKSKHRCQQHQQQTRELHPISCQWNGGPAYPSTLHGGGPNSMTYGHSGHSCCACGHSFSSCLAANHSSHLTGYPQSSCHMHPPGMCQACLHQPPTSHGPFPAQSCLNGRLPHMMNIQEADHRIAMSPGSHKGSLAAGCHGSPTHQTLADGSSPRVLCGQPLQMGFPQSSLYDYSHAEIPVNLPYSAMPHDNSYLKNGQGIPTVLPQTLLGNQQLQNFAKSPEDNYVVSYGDMIGRPKMSRQCSNDYNPGEHTGGDKRLRASEDEGGRLVENKISAAARRQNVSNDCNSNKGKGRNWTEQTTIDSSDLYGCSVPPTEQGLARIHPAESGNHPAMAPEIQGQASPMITGVRKDQGFAPGSPHCVGLSTVGTNNHLVNDDTLDSKTSLKFLKELSESDRFKPTDAYKDVFVDQKIEPERRNKPGKDSLDSKNSSGSSYSGKSQASSTFPMRIKPGVEDLSLTNLKISKATSMPKNMKPPEFYKAYRHIRVFVTYSNGNKEDCKQVLSLCRFLEFNGFSCCVDDSENSDSVQSLEMAEWCRSKFLEVDFILACISPDYIKDISSPEPISRAGRQLHTRQIYEMMNSEYLNIQQSGKAVLDTMRFIPLLFGKMTRECLPPLLTGGPVYMWPSEYMDLAWMLSKPQERIKTSRQAY